VDLEQPDRVHPLIRRRAGHRRRGVRQARL